MKKEEVILKRSPSRFIIHISISYMIYNILLNTYVYIKSIGCSLLTNKVLK